MSPRLPAVSRKLAYEHILRSLDSANDLLIECCHDIDDIDLDAAKNTRDLNQVLGWIHEARSDIYRAVPELEPPPTPLPRRRWSLDPKRRRRARYSRKEAIDRLKHNLELVGLILRESMPIARSIRMGKGVSGQLENVDNIRNQVLQDIWENLTDRGRRSWVSDFGKPKGVAEPPPPDRDRTLERLNEKLTTAAQLLNDCAELVVELDISGNGRLSAVGTCLGMVFLVQHQIYEKRPDLVPLFLKGSYELKAREAKEKERKKKS